MLDINMTHDYDSSPNSDVTEELAMQISELPVEAPVIINVQDPGLQVALTHIQESIQQLSQSFDFKIKYDSHKEHLINQLHQELQGYKNEMHLKMLKPLLLDIIQMIDDLHKLITTYQAIPADQLDAQKLLDQLSSIPEDLKSILYRQGIDSYQHHEPQFDPVHQRIIKRVDGVDRNQDKQVAESLREGYLWEGKVLRPELVSVYRFIPPAEDIDQVTT